MYNMRLNGGSCSVPCHTSLFPVADRVHDMRCKRWLICRCLAVLIFAESQLKYSCHDHKFMPERFISEVQAEADMNFFRRFIRRACVVYLAMHGTMWNTGLKNGSSVSSSELSR